MRVSSLLLVFVLLQCAARASGDDIQRIVVISDLNGRYASTTYHPRVASAVARIVELAPDLVISTGDMVAGQRASPKLQREELDAMWASFHRQVRSPLEKAGIPLVTTPGNHDASAYPGFEREREAYARYNADNPPLFQTRNGGNFPYYFATVINDLLLISLDATTASPLDKSQYNWLAKQLCDQGQYRAKILFGHLPLQPVAIGRERDVIFDPRLESLMAASGVSAYLSGHHHAFYPGSRMGIDMLSIGNLGGNQRQLVDTAQTTGFSFAMIEIDSENRVEISAYSGPEFNATIDISLLPEHLGDGDRRLSRRDIAASIWLPDFSADVQALKLEDVDKNLSGITYNPDSGNLWVIINNPQQLVELNSRLEPLRTITLENFRDTEAIAYIGKDRYVIADEKNESISVASINAETTSIDYTNLQRIALNKGGKGNSAFEGIAVDPRDNSVLVAREQNPMEVIKISGLLDKDSSIEIAIKLDTQEIDVALDDLSGLHFDPGTGHLLLLSDEAKLLAEFNQNGETVSYMDLESGFSGLRRDIPQAEGVTLDSEGNLYIVSEPNLIYRFKKPSLTP